MKKDGPVGLEMLTYRDPNSKEGSDGYYMMLLSPGAWESERAVPKDVVFAVDTSGSMRVEKLDQAKAALAFLHRFAQRRGSVRHRSLLDGG